MTAPDTTTREHRGPYGRAVRLDVSDTPEAAQTVDHWLLTAPAFHPMWSQYLLGCVRLDDLPGWPEPYRKFDGATHEVHVIVLDPDHGPYTPAMLHARQGHYLLPINIAEQFEATDDEMRQLVWFAARAVVCGALNPETGDAPDQIRYCWLGSLVRTLAHIRGEVHAP